MGNDLLFKTNDFIFSYRVAGLIRNGDKILLQKPLNDKGYSLIGGHVTLNETTEDAIKREISEELHTEISVDRLFAIGEIFFHWDNKPCHQISLYYNVSLKNEKSIPMDGLFKGYDEIGNKKINIDFCWISLSDLHNIDIYPKEIMPCILASDKDIYHFISNQL